MLLNEVLQALQEGTYDKTFNYLYSGNGTAQRERYLEAVKEFAGLYGPDRDILLVSAPGRTEVGGNHTDHQNGCVLAAGVNLDIICVVSANGGDTIRIKSKGYKEDVVDIGDLSPKEAERNKAVSLIRGIAADCVQRGYKLGGFDAYTTSDVLKGSGLSSSAAFEVAIGNMVSHLFNGGGIDAVEVAQIAQHAENAYFGKPSGLMDQMASSVGSFVAIDFLDTEKPVIRPVPFDLGKSGYTLCVVDTKGDHADLTHEYAAVPVEMKRVAEFLGARVLRDVDEQELLLRLPQVREACGDRAVLRALHFYEDNRRAQQEAQALEQGDFPAFLRLVVESGRSSQAVLQNVFASSDPHNQGLSIALALSERLLQGKGAWRVHGGGFAGTIQAFVPNGLLQEYIKTMNAVFGDDACHTLSVRPVGGVQVTPGLHA